MACQSETNSLTEYAYLSLPHVRYGVFLGDDFCHGIGCHVFKMVVMLYLGRWINFNVEEFFSTHVLV